MATLEKAITINAPAKKVFTFLSRPQNWKEIYPKITEIRDVNQLLSGGYRYSWKFKMVAGIPCEVRSENTGLVANRSIGLKNICSIGGVRYVELDETLSFHPEDGKTKLTYRAKNRVPVPLIHAPFEFLFMKMNGRRVDSFVSNLKAKMEG
jgi:ligand-binding SRPBCC domain-containing protein